MRRHALAIAIALAATRAPVVAAPGDAAEYARVFATPLRASRAPLELSIDGARLDTIVVELAPDAEPVAPTAVLATLLDARVRESARAALRLGLRGPRITLAALRALGFGVTFDAAKLTLRIEIPPALGPTTSHALRFEGAPPEAADAIGPSDVAGYINFHGRAGGRVSSGDARTDLDPVALAVDGSLDIARWVVEARADLAEQPLGARRGDVLVSHDDPAHAVRYFAGDFAMPAAGFEPTYPVLGIGVARNFTLQPYRTLQPVGVFEFVLERAARVTVMVAGSPVQTLSLAAGRHDLRDLPLGAGITEVELVIRDETGEHRLVFAAIHPAELLAPGTVQFSVGLGFMRIDDRGLRDYDFARPLVSGRRRWGVTSRLTVGGAFDVALDQQLAGAGVVLATTRGNVALDAAASASAHGRLGHAVGLRYDYLRGEGAGVRGSLSIAAHHVSAAFRDLAPADALTRTHDELAVAATHRLGVATFARLGLREVLGGERDASFAVTHAIGEISLDAELDLRDGGRAPAEARGFIALHWNLAAHRTTAHATTRASSLDGASTELIVHHAPEHAVGGVATTIGLRESASDYAATAAASYTDYAFVGATTSTVSFDRHRQDATDTTMVEVGTALAFADGRVAWSRPITGSFAIVEATESLATEAIGVGPSRGGYAAHTNAFGLAVVPSLEAYRVGVIRLDAPGLPLGVSLGPSTYHVLPTYHSGTLVVVGTRGTVFLRGVVTRGGAPLPFETGELTSPGARPLEVMTNRAGRFSVVDVAPGSYELAIGDGTATIVVPSGAHGIIDVGVIAISPRTSSAPAGSRRAMRAGSPP